MKMDRKELNKIIESAVEFSRGKRINAHMRVAVLGVRGWLIAHQKERGKVMVIIEGEPVWINVNNVCRLDILNKRIKTLCQI